MVSTSKIKKKRSDFQIQNFSIDLSKIRTKIPHYLKTAQPIKMKFAASNFSRQTILEKHKDMISTSKIKKRGPIFKFGKFSG